MRRRDMTPVSFKVNASLRGGALPGWAWSPIKFQADLGILLTFMFLWNMLGALIPALARLILRPKEPHGQPGKARQALAAKPAQS